jgi:hypothetical protein
MLKKNFHSRYLWAIYATVTALAIICMFVGLNLRNTLWQSVLINLATELLGAVFIFIIVNRFFLLDQWQTSDRIDKLLEHLEKNKTASAEHFFTDLPHFDSYIAGAQTIMWFGVTMEEEIHTNLPRLKERILAGCNVSIMVADPESKAIEMSSLRSKGILPNRFAKKLDGVLDDLAYLQQEIKGIKPLNPNSPKGSISIRLLPYAPSFGIFAFNAGENHGTIFVEVFGHADGFGSFPSFELTSRKDGKWYNFFLSQFRQMWDLADQWQPDDPPTVKEGRNNEPQ